MAVKLRQVHEDLHELGPNVRIERGPELKSAVANEETTSDAVTAGHYHLPKRVALGGNVLELVANDALGKPIRRGQTFHYLDHLKPRNEQGWYVYRRETENPRQVVAEHDERGFPKLDKAGQPLMKADDDDWREVGYFQSYEEALAAAHEAAR
jgi:hypothetical protein